MKTPQPEVQGRTAGAPPSWRGASLTSVGPLLALGGLALLTAPHAQAAPGAETPLEVWTRETPVAPGVLWTARRQLDAAGWLDIDVLSVDLGEAQNRLALLTPGAVAERATVVDLVARSGGVAGINGDFFHIGGSGAALGAQIGEGRLFKGPDPGWTEHAAITSDRIGVLTQLALVGKVKLPSGPAPLAGFNQQGLRPGIAVFTPAWGSPAELSAVVADAPAVFAVIEGGPENGRVRRVTEELANVEIPTQGYLLVGMGADRESVTRLQIGDAVSYRAETDAVRELAVAVAGNRRLLTDGQPVPGLDDEVRAPRSAIGFDALGRTLYLLAVDGRQADSRGTTDAETARLLAEFGAYAALNLDGGGSTTLVARAPGTPEPGVANDPSDGELRAVPNGIGVASQPGSGIATAIRLHPLGQPLQGGPHDPVGPGAGLERVFPGLRRSIQAFPFDETYAPAEAQLRWRAQPSRRLRVRKTQDGAVVTGRRPGPVEVRARTRGAAKAEGRLQLHVLGPLERLTFEPENVALEAADETIRISLIGWDEDGYRAPIDPSDVRLRFDTSVIQVQADGPEIELTAVQSPESTILEARVGSRVAYLPVTTGLVANSVEGFDFGGGTGDWSTFDIGAPNPELSPATGIDGTSNSALQLDYDFRGDRSTRAAYFVTPGTALPLPGEPRRIRLSVLGDGNGAWLRASVVDAAGTRATLNFTDQDTGVDWTGWRSVVASVPSGLAYPLALRLVYPVETDASARYAGRLTIDDLGVDVAPSLEVPNASDPRDPLILGSEGFSADPKAEPRWTFAVLNDSQFSAATGEDSELVRDTRRTLREVLKSGAEFLIINGDFVDTSFPEDFALAETILREEIGGKIPVYYQPGNHEIIGTSRLDEFVAAFGETRRSFDHRGTRFVLLNSAFGSLRNSDFTQLVELRRSLDEAAQRSEIKNVIVMAHHPLEDPAPSGNSQLADRLEAELLRRWFSEFEAESDKNIAYIAGHAGSFAVERVDGVEYLVVGNTAKAPSTAADNGGFTGWVELGVLPNPERCRPRRGRSPDRCPWILADVNPLTDRLRIESMPSELVPGTEVRIDVDAVQPGGRVVPVDYPMSVGWEGDRVLVLGQDRFFVGWWRAVAIFDPTSRLLTALRPGTGRLRARTGTESIDVSVRVDRAP